jgi:hypothetical protein
VTDVHEFFHALKQPEYIHVLLNPLPVCGLAMGVLGLIIGLAMRNKQAQIVGLVIVAVACLSVWPVSHYGERGADRVQAMSNRDAQLWLHEHEERAEVGQWFFYCTAALAIVSMACQAPFQKAATKLSLVTVLAALVCLGIGGWISRAGGQIRHSEFRDGPPPVTE